MDKIFDLIEIKLEGGKVVPGFFVTSPQIPGLITQGPTIPEALEQAAKVIRDLALAGAMEVAAGRTVKPMFKQVPVAQTAEART